MHRLAALDGLRGLAALVVLVHHALLLVPALAAPYYGQPTSPGWPTLLVETPLHLMWAGTEAVYLFFILSGLVLGLSVRSSRFEWETYFPSRLIRLYLPVIGAVLFGWLTMLLVPRVGADGAWLERRPAQYTILGVLQDSTLLGGTSGAVSPLWSLQWEVLFSLLLPVYVMAARHVNPVIAGVVCVAAATFSAANGSPIGTYLPMFGIGIALAQGWAAIESWTSRTRGALGVIAWTAVIAAALIGTISKWIEFPIVGRLGQPIWMPIVLVSITALIVGAARFPPLARLLSTRVFALLGALSFSLYLVHEPIVIAMRFLTGSSFAAILIGIPAALIIAWLFHRAIERPAHLLARRVRRPAQVAQERAAQVAQEEEQPAVKI